VTRTDLGPLAITSYPALDVLIGLAFLYFLLSVIASAINEGIATAFNLRAKTLGAGLKQLLGDQAAADRFLDDKRVQALFKPRRFLGWIPGLRDKRPAYIPSRVFAFTLLHTFAGDSDSHDLFEQARKVVTLAPNQRVKQIADDAITEAQGDVEELRKSLERQFDEVMQRASGWYKRKVQLILFVIALGLVGAINADSFVIGQRLWKDDVLRTAVVAQATSTVNDKQAACTKPSEPGGTQTPAQTAGRCLDEVKELNLPVGWSTASSPHGWIEGFAKALGLLLTAFALLLGAPFWFDTLSKLAQLRGTGRASSDPGTTEGATTTTG
jgi:hypothetical protein